MSASDHQSSSSSKAGTNITYHKRLTGTGGRPVELMTNRELAEEQAPPPGYFERTGKGFVVPGLYAKDIKSGPIEWDDPDDEQERLEKEKQWQNHFGPTGLVTKREEEEQKAARLSAPRTPNNNSGLSYLATLPPTASSTPRPKPRTKAFKPISQEASPQPERKLASLTLAQIVGHSYVAQGSNRPKTLVAGHDAAQIKNAIRELNGAPEVDILQVTVQQLGTGSNKMHVVPGNRGTYSLIICANADHYLTPTQLPTMLRSLGRYLQPHGQIFALAPTHSPIAPALYRLLQAELENYRVAALKAGMVVERCNGINFDETFGPDPLDVTRAIKAMEWVVEDHQGDIAAAAIAERGWLEGVEKDLKANRQGFEVPVLKQFCPKPLLWLTYRRGERDQSFSRAIKKEEEEDEEGPQNEGTVDEGVEDGKVKDEDGDEVEVKKEDDDDE